MKIKGCRMTLFSERILMAEDEEAMQVSQVDCLRASGYRPLFSGDGKAALDMVFSQKPDLILLDIMMPELNGFSLCREVRRLGITTPIVFLSPKALESDKVRGLDAGGDDYFVKPFSSAELLALVRANLRRQTIGKPSPVQFLFLLGRVILDFHSMKASLIPPEDMDIHLTAKEWQMLMFLAQQPGKAGSREQFLDVVCGVHASPSTRNVDDHIASLRSKIEPNPAKPACLKTIHGHGYRLEPNSMSILPSHDNSSIQPFLPAYRYEKPR